MYDFYHCQAWISKSRQIICNPLMEIFIVYDKKLVIQALRFHFIKRPEIRIMMILVNVFALFSAALFYFKKVSPLAFLISSFLWVALMVSFWFVLPYTVYNKAATFKGSFKMKFRESGILLESDRGFTDWPWEKFSTYFETPHFIHLYFDSKSFFLIPKAAFASEENLRDLRILLIRNISQ